MAGQHMLHLLFIFVTGILFLQTGNTPQTVWDEEKLKTTTNVNYLSEFEKEVIFELNKARSNPSKFAEEYLDDLVDAYDGKLLVVPGEVPIQTFEGKKALLECIRVMKKTDPLPLLYPSKGLSRAAALLVKDQQKTGQVGHFGSNGSNPQQRIEQYGNWLEKFAENITYGNNSPRRVVISLLVDDGVPDRGHRKNLLDKTFKTVGLATGDHPKYKQMCVMEMAGGFEDQ